MPRHRMDSDTEKRRWLELLEATRNPHHLQPTPRPAQTESVSNPRLGVCEVQGRDSTWQAVDTSVDRGRRCSNTVDIKETVAHALGFQHEVRHFKRKIYRKLGDHKLKAIGTIVLPFKNFAGETESLEAVVLEDLNVPFNIKLHYTVAPRLLKSKEESIERGIPVLRISDHAGATAESQPKQGPPRVLHPSDQPTAHSGSQFSHLAPLLDQPTATAESRVRLKISRVNPAFERTTNPAGVQLPHVPLLFDQPIAHSGSQLKQGLPDVPLFFDRPTEPRDTSQDVANPAPSAGDSGYASTPTLAWLISSLKADTSHGSDHVTANDRQSDNDAATCYTSSSTDGQFVRVYLQEFAEDIYSSLHLERHKDEWDALSEDLPIFLKAFAIKVGHSSNSPLHRNVMQFVHKHCQEIIKSISALMSDDDETLIHRDSNMSLADKMALWDAKDGDQPAPEKESMFDGVGDDEYELDEAKISEYRDLIAGSPPYHWLLSTLRREMLQHNKPGTEPVNEIRKTILSKLPSGEISKRRSPLVYETTFRLACSPPHGTLGTMLAFTLNSGWLHASSVEEYLHYMWPASGKDLVDFLQRAYDSQGSTVHDMRPDRTELSASFSHGWLEFGVCGSGFAVAEYGEQMSWLTAATQKAEKTAMTHRPYIGHIQVVAAQQDKTPRRSVHCTVELGPDPGGATVGWEPILNHHSVVRGFPIPPKPEGCSGIDASFETLTNLVGGVLQIVSKRILLFGSRCSLGLVTHGKKTTSWRLISQQSQGSRWQSMKQAIYRLPEQTSQVLAVFRSAAGSNGNRHFIIDCTCDSRGLGHHCCYEKAGGGSGTSNRPESGTDSLGEIGSLHPEALPDSRFGSTLTSSEYSIDSAMLSLSDASDLADPFGLGEECGKILSSCLHRLLEERHGIRGKQQSPGQSIQAAGGAPTQTSSSFSSSSASRHFKPDKRPRDSGIGSSLDGSSYARTDTKRRKTEDPSPKIWACPFWKYDPGKHWECLQKLTRIRDVKQHLTRHHSPKSHCPLCFEVFAGQEMCNAHLLTYPRCAERPDGRFDFVPSHKRTSLQARSSQKHTEEEKWFVIWDILFEEAERPISPYRVSDNAEWYSLCEKRGPDILTESITGHYNDLHGLSLAEWEPAMRRIVRDGFRDLFREGESAGLPSSEDDVAASHDTQSLVEAHSGQVEGRLPECWSTHEKASLGILGEGVFGSGRLPSFAHHLAAFGDLQDTADSLDLLAMTNDGTEDTLAWGPPWDVDAPCTTAGRAVEDETE